MIIEKAKHGPGKCWYDRKVSQSTGEKSRQYHAFGLSRVVFGSGESFWRLIIGPWVFVFGYEDRRP